MPDAQGPTSNAARLAPSRRNFVMAVASTAAAPAVARTLIADAAQARKQSADMSCLTLAVVAQGKAVTTIEGLAGADDVLHPMQQAFIDNDALQCGYCTPGQIMSAVACVEEGHAGSDADIREYMSGNLCRCAAYPNIVAAVNQAKPLMRTALKD
jgi:aerobic-type carbon monoxide dehydrogenase small subunit (CoxS/CutS family)